jgi:hypothetical protein
MASPGIAQQARDPRVTALHASALTIAVLSGTCALVALVAGSPLEFGVALALCGAGWIAADFIDWAVEDAHADRRCAIPAAGIGPDYGSPRLVFIGSGECSSRPMRRAEISPAASHFCASAPIEMTTFRQSA